MLTARSQRAISRKYQSPPAQSKAPAFGSGLAVLFYKIYFMQNKLIPRFVSKAKYSNTTKYWSTLFPKGY
jgi:hypothetical protein